MSPPVDSRSLLLAAAALVVVSTGVFGALAWRLHGAAPVGRPALSAPPYAAAALEPPAVKPTAWSAPVAQARGRDWLYDVFTPPEIFYNPRTRQFAVSAATVGATSVLDEPFGLELASVRPEPFRLQLIGFVGGAGERARGIFENRVSGEVFLASAGHRVADLGLSIRSFAVGPETVAIPESMTFQQQVARAVIRDARSNRDVALTQRERRFTGNVFAFVVLGDETANREVRPGDTLAFGPASYRIEKIIADPAGIEVTKTSPDLDAPQRRTLPVRFDPNDTAPGTP